MDGFAVLASPGLGWETDETAGQRPALRQTWGIDPATGKPVARWIGEVPAPVVAAPPGPAPAHELDLGGRLSVSGLRDARIDG